MEDLMQLHEGMARYRVVDRQAECKLPSRQAEIRIAGKTYRRRVLEAPVVLSLIQECTAKHPEADGWHVEGDLRTVDDGWTMLTVYAGDTKCSASTWWNTGNPRPLVERWITPLDIAPGNSDSATASLLDALDRRFERCTYLAADLPEGRWLAAPYSDVRATIEGLLVQGWPRNKRSTRWRKSPGDPRSMVYLMAEAGSAWIKVGTCKAGGTSPPERRRGMYQPGNRREITVAAAWCIEGSNPEMSMKAALRRHCAQAGIPYRAEWFEVGAAGALNLLTPIVERCIRVT